MAQIRIPSIALRYGWLILRTAKTRDNFRGSDLASLCKFPSNSQEFHKEGSKD